MYLFTYICTSMNKIIGFAVLLSWGLLGCKRDNVNINIDSSVNYKTTAFFISNKDTIRYSDSSRNTEVVYSPSKVYAITLGLALRVISDSLQTQLYVGQLIKMPYFRYYGPYSDHGTDLQNNNIAPGSGSTVALKITRVGNDNFDATFSGKVWSVKDVDTLFIKEGQLTQAKLPSQ